MRKSIEVQIPDLFNLQPSIPEQTMDYLRKNKRATSRILAKAFKVSDSTTYRTLLNLTAQGLVRDLGIHRVGKNSQRVYEII